MRELVKVGITGKRRLLGPEDQVRDQVRGYLDELLRTTQQVTVLSGMALGFDQLVCSVILDMIRAGQHPEVHTRLEYTAVVPCEGQDSRWSKTQQDLYLVLMVRAREIIQVNEGPCETWKYHARNRWIVDHADEMLVHWDGNFMGGTGQCMRLVNAKKLQYTNVTGSE